MSGHAARKLALVVLAVGAAALVALADWNSTPPAPRGRREVVFWHFWGGRHRAVVEDIVRRFNESQSEHFVRAVAVPGHNLDVKFFLSVAGDDPPDVLNQDDPVVADWAYRGAIVPLDELAGAEEIERLSNWLFPAARQIGTYEGRLYALCNGLDIRALYYDQRLLDEHGLKPPRTLAELDRLALVVAPPDEPGPRRGFGYLPDPRRLWAWGIVFGGEFYDPATDRVSADSDRIVAALDWMASYSRRYGANQVAAFRKGDQALTGAAFPLLQGRYAVVMDGQWRIAELEAAQGAARAQGRPAPVYGVVPLPPPPGGRQRAGWVNGNFFVVPRGAKNPVGAWAFMKFWSGFGGYESEAARACVAGGWIPASPEVVREPAMEHYLNAHPAFRTFVDLAASPNQAPTPSVPGAAYFYDEILRAAEDAMYRGTPPRAALESAARRIRVRLKELRAGGKQLPAEVDER